MQAHLARVYATLAAAVAVSAAGAAVDIFFHLSGWLATAALFGCVFGLAATPAAPSTLARRRGLLAGAAAAQGVLMGPLAGAALALHPGALVAALAATGAVFACFSAAALVTRRRAYLYLGALCSSAVSALLALRLGSWVFGGGAAVMEAEIYGGLLVFCGYVIFDTQSIVERAHGGDMDEVRHALELFTDFAALFVRLLIIALRSAERRQRRDAERQRRGDKRRQ